jgi:NTE family protein
MNEMQPPRAKARRDNISAIANRYDRVALVLQGGGALGAYQIGVYQALAEAGCEPNWISGVSIGAINSAIIAGNGPKKRLQKLEAFWNTISGRKICSARAASSRVRCRTFSPATRKSCIRAAPARIPTPSPAPTI